MLMSPQNFQDLGINFFVLLKTEGIQSFCIIFHPKERLRIMKFEDFTLNDLEHLPSLEPPNWGSLSPRFTRFVQSDHCSPVKLTLNSTTIGIGTTIRHEDTAWLACIIVHPDHRNKGLGKLITEYLIDSLDRNRFQSIYLIATELGYPVYKKLGFELEKEYVHLKTEEELPESELSPDIISYKEAFREEVMKLDASITGENRINSLKDHLKTSLLFIEDGVVSGYYLPSLGEGHILASNTKAGTELMKARLQNSKIAIFPSDNNVANDLAKEMGFKQYTISRRMVLGKKKEWNSLNMYNRIGGHLG